MSFKLFMFSKSNNQYGIVHLPVLFLFAVLALGSGTVVLADSSKPGDLLYGVDRGVENVWLSLIQDQESEVEFKVKLAEERLEEASQLVGDEEREDDMEEALGSYKDEKEDIEVSVGTDSSVFKNLLNDEEEFLNFVDSFGGRVKIEIESDDGEMEIEVELEDEDEDDSRDLDDEEEDESEDGDVEEDEEEDEDENGDEDDEDEEDSNDDDEDEDEDEEDEEDNGDDQEDDDEEEDDSEED